MQETDKSYGYDDSECNSRMLPEGSYRFSLDPGKHTLWRKLGGENLFQYEHFYEHLKWTTLREQNKTNDPILNLTPENIIQHSRIE